jgi:hypothetical protein
MTIKRKRTPIKRRPTIGCDVWEWERTYSSEDIDAIIDAAGWPVIEAERDWLRRELCACAIYYAAQLAVDEGETTGQKSKAAWDEYIADLKKAFEQAFGKRATGTVGYNGKGGPFIRFAIAAMSKIGIPELTPNKIRDALRKKQPGGGKQRERI